MKKQNIIVLIESGDAFLSERNYVKAYNSYELALNAIVEENRNDKRFKLLGSFAGWTAGFLTGGLGLEDLFIVPAVSKGVSKVFGVDDAFVNEAIQLLLLKQIDCILDNPFLAKSISKEVILSKFFILFRTLEPYSILEKVLDWYLPEISAKNVLDRERIVDSTLSYLSEAINMNHPLAEQFDFLLYSYLKKVGDRSELYELLSRKFDGDRGFSYDREYEYSSDNGPVNEPDLEVDYYKILGVPYGASPEEIKKAYYELMKKYHPDRFASLSPEFQELANQKAKMINNAYSYLMNQFNTKGETYG